MVSWIPSDYTLRGCSSSVRPQTSQGFVASKVKSIIPPPHRPPPPHSPLISCQTGCTLHCQQAETAKGRGVSEKRLRLWISRGGSSRRSPEKYSSSAAADSSDSTNTLINAARRSTEGSEPNLSLSPVEVL